MIHTASQFAGDLDISIYEHAGTDLDNLRLSQSLHLLNETYKSYVLALPPNETSLKCRFNVMLFTKEVVESIQSLLKDETMSTQ